MQEEVSQTRDAIGSQATEEETNLCKEILAMQEEVIRTRDAIGNQATEEETNLYDEIHALDPQSRPPSTVPVVDLTR